MTPAFPHRQSAHCESGVASNLFAFHGVAVSEAMVFGVGSGLFFGHFPFVRIHNLPLTAFRAAPGRIIRRAAKRLGIEIHFRSFRSEARGMEELDRLLGEGIPVGAQAGVYWLPYFPPALRFHFNAHNLIVAEKEGDGYRISDPVFPEAVHCTAEDLRRARFAQGQLAPRGRIYYVRAVPAKIDLEAAVTRAIREVCFLMTRVPVPLIGVRGIRYLARRVEGWPDRYGERGALLQLANLIRMQEEIGTGGGGFRFIYAAFLQEAAAVLADDRLLDLSREMTAVGDRWRDFASAGARRCKGRSEGDDAFGDLARILRDCADREEAIFRKLAAAIRGGRRAG